MRRVLITGASRGIGKAVAERFHSAGYDLITPQHRELDVSSIDSIRDYVMRDNKLAIDVLINNAGENKINLIKDMPIEDWQRIIATNLTAPFMLIKYVTGHMMSEGWGRIVNISSCYSLVSRSGRAAYSASKAGLNALTRTAALEYAESNILVNSVCPGFIDTEMTRKNNSPEQISALCQQIPMNRLGTPDEVADFVFYLGSEQNTYITGQTLAIDGGFMSQ